MNVPLTPDPRRIAILARPIQEVREQLRRSPQGLSALRRFWRHHFRSYYFMRVPRWRMTLREISSRERVAPDFALTGPVRSGTSALTEYVFQHPCVALPLAKEPPIYRWSLQHILAPFPTRKQIDTLRAERGVALTGYCTPVVPDLWWPHIAKAINPNLRVVVILRDPVERAFSQWRWDRQLLWRSRNDVIWRHFPSFDAAVKLEIASVREGGGGFRTVSGTRAGYLLQSIYLPFLRLLFEVFGRQSVRVVNASDFFRDPLLVAREACAFLGLPAYQPVRVDEHNAGPASQIDQGTRAMLQEFFAPHNEKLYDFLGRDFGWTGRGLC